MPENKKTGKTSADAFEERCYSVLKRVPRGKVTTYAAIAGALNSRAYQAVGNAMRKNRDPMVPCHRVICSDGRIGGYNRGKRMKAIMLKREGVTVKNGRVNLNAYKARFN